VITCSIYPYKAESIRDFNHGRKRFSRKGAKAQSAAAFLAVFFAPLRRCVFA
jgi:hypothetical protein